MASSSQSTGAMLGVGGSVIDIANWWFTGHPFPLPDDTKIAFVVVGPYLLHVTSEFVNRFLPEKKQP